MEVITVDLGPVAVTVEIDTPEGKVTLMNTPERLSAMLDEKQRQTG